MGILDTTGRPDTMGKSDTIGKSNSPGGSETMYGTLCVLCCQNFHAEVKAAIEAEGWPDVTVASFPSECGHPPLRWDDLRPLLRDGCTQVHIIGRACLKELGDPPGNWPPVRLVALEDCFHLVAGSAMVAEALTRGAYLISPGWLEDWRGNLRRMGLAEGHAKEFFQDFARELVLFDTGILPDSDQKLGAFAGVVDLPATRIGVGIDYTRLLLVRLVTEWRLDQMQKYVNERERENNRERANQISAMDFLGRMALLTDEEQVVQTIEETFRMLFAPEELHYVRLKNEAPVFEATIPVILAKQIRAMKGDWAWTDSGAGFILRISRAGETIALIAVDRVAFPVHLKKYLNLALSIAGVCGLAIVNARTYRRKMDVEEALRRSERSLKLAQAIAHIGHWEWEVESGDIKWSEETYRILGYEPQTIQPSADAFFHVIHPEDRARVETHINQLQEGSRFDIEYRIILPGGDMRVVHGMGEILSHSAGQQAPIIGVIRDVSHSRPAEVLGVIQDITERKELEWRLEQEAHTDALTDCANRRYFMQQAHHEFERMRRYGGELSTLMLDLDHFKQVNDRYGHQVGDLTLRALVLVCRSTLRGGDVIGRLGGEEFGILLPETDAAHALEVAERLRQAVSAKAIAVVNEPPLHVTTSIGIATVSTDDTTIDQVLERADQGLYKAKNSGRNRVVAIQSKSSAPD